MRLEGTAAIITGAGQGIGRGIAECFASEGAGLILNDLEPEAARGALEAVRALGARATVVAGDVSKQQIARNLVAAALRHYGRIDVLVNNAGIGGSAHGDGPVTESREDSWDKVLRVNLKSVFLCCRYAIPEMMRGGGGSVINLSSILALAGSSRFTSHAYAASKGAIVSLTRAMAIYYAPHSVRVNAVCPGLIETPLTVKSKRKPAVMRYVRERQRLVGGLGSVEDVASAVLFLASNESRLITGAILPLDAGWSAGS
ncbi:MAG TPA: glucose 1-dehydrogenase [Bryobacteraceae bacterium]|nr:glucose 1-dehydrogenase [Bryobacteraceae bacterium]